MRVAVVLAIVLAGCSSPPDVEEPWHGRDTSQDGWQSWILKPCAALELDWPQRASLQWDWFITDRTSVRWDLHTHDGGADTLQSRVAPEGNATFDAAGRSLSMTWINPHDDDVELWFLVTPGSIARTGAWPDCP